MKKRFLGALVLGMLHGAAGDSAYSKIDMVPDYSYLSEKKPKLYFDLGEPERYLVFRRELERINLEIMFSGNLEYDWERLRFDYDTFRFDLKLKINLKR